jgi:SAM-dependent methyltransferase
MTSPRLQVLLGDLDFESETQAPMGGINPNSPQFDLIGKQFHQLLVDHAKFTPKKDILDLGCGTGRLSKQLHDWMKPEGSYTGLEINKRFCDYCVKNYKGRYDLLDAQHDEYNPGGVIQANEITLPYDDCSFDVVVAVALFNHFRLDWAVRYLEEISRILKHKGILFATAILINPISVESTKLRKTHPFKFEKREDQEWFDFDERPLFNVALSENVLRRTMMKHGLMIKEPIRYGEWCGSKAAITGHDVILARKGGWGP